MDHVKRVGLALVQALILISFLSWCKNCRFSFFRNKVHILCHQAMGSDFFHSRLLGITNRDYKLSNEPKMCSIASVLSIWRSVGKCPKNYLPLKKSFFCHFLVKIDDLKIFIVSLHILVCSLLIAHQITRLSAKKLGTHYKYCALQIFFRIVHHKC